MLSLVSLAHRVLHAEILHQALQTRVPSVKRLGLAPQLWAPVQKCCTGPCYARWQGQAQCRCTAPTPPTHCFLKPWAANVVVVGGGVPAWTRPLPADKNPIKQPQSNAFGDEHVIESLNSHLFILWLPLRPNQTRSPTGSKTPVRRTLAGDWLRSVITIPSFFSYYLIVSLYKF